MRHHQVSCQCQPQNDQMIQAKNQLLLAITILLLALYSSSVWAEESALKLANIFADHAVLQRDIELPVWGWAAAGESVTVSIDGKNVAAKADDTGKWMARFPAFPAGGPYIMTVTGKDSKLAVTDILIGDVWICSGQSNMEFHVNSSNNAKAEIEAANFPQFRQFHVEKAAMPSPMPDVSGEWTVASPDTVGAWTAVGFFFGRDLHQHLNVPIGLISTSWGGTRVEAWTSLEVIKEQYGDKQQKEFTDLSEMNTKLEGPMEKYTEDMKAFKESFAKFIKYDSDVNHLQKYVSPDLDDSSWKPIKTPSEWEKDGHPNLDGEVIYRKTIDIPANWAGKELLLLPGAIDEIETTFFNGTQVGKAGSLSPIDTSQWHLQRTYKVPANLVKAGKAVIAIQVIDQCGGGGLIGPDPKMMKIYPIDNESAAISLADGWKHLVTFEIPARPKNPLNPNIITVLYNGMVSGLIPYAIRGAIWYQGESNANGLQAYLYRDRFAAMITDWRARWKQGDFPFLWVSLANFRDFTNEPGDPQSLWAVLRDSQQATLKLPNTGTAMAIDIGDAKDIHPKNKQDVGHRLAFAARHIAYGEQLVYSGPMYKSMMVENGAIRLAFDHVGTGLVAKDGALKQFAIAGKDQKFVWADAVIDGSTVVVKSDKVKDPVAVRYAWANNPEGCNLYNKEGLPAAPFRTDDWLLISQPVK